MKVTIEIEVTDLDMQAAYFASMGEDGSVSAKDLVDFYIKPVIEHKLKSLRDRMRWKLGDYGHHPSIRHEIWSMNTYPIPVYEPIEGSGITRCETSPTSLCWYDEEQDPAHDHCVFCGNGHERK